MSTLRDDLLPVLRDGRQLIQDLGLRPYRVVVRTRTWSGSKVRLGTPTDSDLEIVPRPKVTEKDGDALLSVEKIDLGTYTLSQLNPSDVAGVEFYYSVTGPNGEFPYSLKSIDTSPRFGFRMILETLNRKRPF